MKKVPLTVKIPCILEMLISSLFVVATLWFLGLGRFPSNTELIVFIILIANGVVAYKCMKGHSIARYILIGLKVFLFLFMPLVLVIVLLWGYLLIWHTASKEYFSSVKQGTTENIESISIGKKKLWRKILVVGGILITVMLSIGFFQNLIRKNSSKEEITKSRIETIVLLVEKYAIENNKLPSEQTLIKHFSKKSVGVDAWGSEMLYDYDGISDSYQLLSMGEDRQLDTEDDIIVRKDRPQRFAPVR